MKGLSSSWGEEFARRTESLKCSVCDGPNPYICECAKQAYLKMFEEAKPSPPKKVSQEDEEWASHKGLICSPTMIECSVCKTGEWKDFCECAKKKWMKWKNAGGWDSGFAPWNYTEPSFGQGDGGKGPWNFVVEPRSGSTKEEDLETKWNQRVSTGLSLCAICSTCGGSSISTCECAKRRWMEEERKKI